ncbi:family with sequence similarity 213, member [Seminavis robusta]|uniref:Peroxiredoxin-like 2A n=1 Tax=Seminavis robusta TaxID=568900 RepID=A0A9N8DZC9_9STRA|nr:family with sequence similarity 213, member [Seminavis robusta]|eukprot:Sro467_g148900.1 family with sequence similarity 213, member (343) ;mRNA; r:21082-22207
MNGDRWGNIKSGKKALNCKRASEQSGVDINDIMLQPIQFMDLKPVPKSNHTILSDILLNSTATEKSAARLQVNAAEGDDSNKVTAVFCIRRAGCGMCRDHGLSLSTQLKPKLHEKGIGLNLFGIVKDLDGSGEGDVSDHRRDRKDKKTSAKILTDFYTNYFPFPMYTDRNWDSFTFLGNRKTSMWRMFQRSSTVYQRYHRKKISNIINDPRGDPLTQGGVLLFDAKGHLRYVYYERYGDELDLEALQWAVQDIVRSTGASSDRNMSNKKEPTVAPRLPRRRGTFDKGLMAGAVGSGGEKPNKNSRDNAPNGIRKPQRRGSIDDAEKAYDLQVQDDGSFDSKQ